MRIKELYDHLKTAIAGVDDIASFYCVEGYLRNDKGDPSEYPKAVLLQPIVSVNKDRTTEFEVAMEFLVTYEETDSELVDAMEKELDAIDEAEILARAFLKQLEDTSPAYLNFGDYRFQSIVNDFADEVYGVELSFKITAGNNLC